MRADAARNRERIVAAARDLVTRDGADMRMDVLAAHAGVAVGTLYRHFPTKTDLLGAVVDESARDLADLAETALRSTADGCSAWAALEEFFGTISEGHSARQAVRQAMAVLGIDSRQAAGQSSGDVTRALTAVRALVAEAQRAGDMRTDVTVADLFMLLAQAPERDDARQRSRYIELVSDGLRPQSARP